MKFTQVVQRAFPLVIAWGAVIILLPLGARAGENGPYTSDADTIGLWHLDETKGTIITDSGPNVYNGSFDPANVTVGVPGIYGTAYKFSGVNGGTRPLIPNEAAMDNLTAFTIEGFARKTENDSHNSTIFGRWKVKQQVFSVYYEPRSKALVAYVCTTDGFECVQWNLPRGNPSVLEEWFHVALTYDQGNTKLWFNGEAVASKLLGTALAYPSSQAGLGLGWNAGDAAYTFEGWLDEVRYSKIARTAFNVKGKLAMLNMLKGRGADRELAECCWGPGTLKSFYTNPFF